MAALLLFMIMLLLLFHKYFFGIFLQSYIIYWLLLLSTRVNATVAEGDELRLFCIQVTSADVGV